MTAPTLSEAQEADLADMLSVAWRRYRDLLGEPPHGTTKQMRALIKLMPLDDWLYGIVAKAVCEELANEDEAKLE